MKKSTQIRLLIIRAIDNIEKTQKRREQLIKIYEEIKKKQKNQEFWIKTTRYLAIAFVIVRITFFCYSNIT